LICHDFGNTHTADYSEERKYCKCLLLLILQALHLCECK
jgi:hypothetical protein